MFETLVWKDDRMLLENLVFRLQHHLNDDWELGNQCFHFYKTKPLVDQYESFFSTRRDFQAGNIFELGIFDGGSTAFWFEYFSPKKHVAIDLMTRPDSDYFKQYVSGKRIEDRVKTYWGVSQDDPVAIRRILDDEFSDSLDVVIDDASHQYGPTKASFETIFPLLRPGGLYIIEDWAWGHWQHFQPSPTADMWNRKDQLTNLVFELIEAVGTESSRRLISAVTVFQLFTVIERGSEPAGDWKDFNLQSHTFRRS